MANNFTTGLYDPTSNYQPGRSPTSVSGVSGGGSSLYAQPSKVPNTSTQMQPPMNPYAVPGAKGGGLVGPYSVPGKGALSTAQVPTGGMTRGSSSLASGYNPTYQSSMNSAPVGPDYGVTRDGFLPTPEMVAGEGPAAGAPPSLPEPNTDPSMVRQPFYPNPMGTDRVVPATDYYDSAYDPTRPGNAPATPGWPEGLPRPPDGVLPGTDAYHRWLRENSIDGRSPLNYQIQQQLLMEQQGYVNPMDLSPWGGADGYTGYVNDTLSQYGLDPGSAPDPFRQDLYSQISGDYAGLADRAAGMVGGVNPYEAMNQIEDFDPTQAAGYDTLAKYMDNVYSDEYGGYMGFDPKVLQTAGIQQAEIGRAAAERAMGDQLASAGLTGQPNALYTSAPMYGEYLQNRIRAIQDPVVQAAELGIQGVGTTMGALGDLYGLGQSADVARANALLEGQGLNLQADLGRAGLYSSLAGQGLGVAADVGLAAGGAGLDAFLQQQALYAGMPMDAYMASLGAAGMRNEDIFRMYENSKDAEASSKNRRLKRRDQETERLNDLANNLGMTVDTIFGATSAGMGGF